MHSSPLPKTPSSSAKLLLVIPPVVRTLDGIYEVETDFTHNLKIYLKNFDHVTFACPAVKGGKVGDGILRSIPIEKIANSDRLTFIPLPMPYREDRYLWHYSTVKNLLRSEIAKADYLVFSPHAKYDWSTLAAKLAIKLKRKYDMESDWNSDSVIRVQLEAMPPGLRKIKRTLMMKSFSQAKRKCLSHSSLALLQGQAVFDAYKDIAPNPHKVLNVQVSEEDRIPADELKAKVSRIREGAPLIISYAGRAIAMKGPLDWMDTIHGLVKTGVRLRATWFGEGALLSEMQDKAERWGVSNIIGFPGVVDRATIMRHMRETDIFLFCHKTDESPRCLTEALASGAPLVGYGSPFPRDLVKACGGGQFADMGDHKGLIDLVAHLNSDREMLATLIESAAKTGRLFDRDSAMQQRVDLIKKYLSPLHSELT